MTTGIDDVEPRGHHTSRRGTARRQRTTVCSAVDAEGQTGDDHHACPGQVSTELGGDLLPVVGRRTRAHDGDPGTRQHRDVTP